MTGFARSVTIDRPAGEVWRHLVDEERFRRWNPTFVRWERLTPGPLVAGARLRETRRAGKSERTTVVEVTDFEEGILFGVATRAMGVRAAYRFWLEPDGARTHVRLDAEVTAGFFLRPFARMLARALEREDGDALERLKRAAEG